MRACARRTGGGNYGSAEGDAITKAMASKGYVAVSIEYDNLSGIGNHATGMAAALGSTRCAFRDDGTSRVAWPTYSELQNDIVLYVSLSRNHVAD
jgi:hypothetical protein